MKQVLFSLLILAAFSLNAQKNDKAPVPIKTTGDIKKEAAIQAQAQTVQEVAVERTNAKMTFESLTVDYGTIEMGQSH